MPDGSLKQRAIEFLTLAAAGDARTAFGRHVGANFRHHNPYFPADAASLIVAMEQNAANHPDMSFTVLEALQDGDRVAVFSHIKQNPDDRGMAVVHRFRFEDERIAELWDLGQPVPADSINPNGMF